MVIPQYPFYTVSPRKYNPFIPHSIIQVDPKLTAYCNHPKSNAHALFTLIKKSGFRRVQV